MGEKEYKAELRRKDSDFPVFSQVIINEEYKLTVECLQKNKIKPKIIFDCGANIGMTSIYFKHFFPDAQIFAFEIDKNNTEILKRNLSLNNMYDIEVIHKGVLDISTKMTVSGHFRDKQSWSRSLVDKGESPASEVVETIKISDFMYENKIENIDLLKLDIEGSEAEIFKSKEETEKILPKTKVIAVEIHEEFIDKKYVRDLMSKFNFIHEKNNETEIFLNKKYLNN